MVSMATAITRLTTTTSNINSSSSSNSSSSINSSSSTVAGLMSLGRRTSELLRLLTNSKAYGTRSFNAVFTRTFQ